MTYQEILDGIVKNRSALISTSDGARLIKVDEILRKINEIEWGLQALAEKLKDDNPDK